MKIGLVYAMTGEIESLLTQENAQPLQTVAGVPFYRIRPDVIACAGGVSKVNAAMATQLLISLYQPDLVLNAGVAGCFEDMPIGSIVLAEGFLQHDVDTSALGDPVGLVSTVNRVQFPTSDLDRAKAAMDRVGVPYRTGWVATGDWFATDTPGPIGSPTPFTRCCAIWRAAPTPRCVCATGCPSCPSSPCPTVCSSTTTLCSISQPPCGI